MPNRQEMLYNPAICTLELVPFPIILILNAPLRVGRMRLLRQAHFYSEPELLLAIPK